MFKGSALTFGGVGFHGEEPFQRYTLQNTNVNTANGLTFANYPGNFLYAPRGSKANTILRIPSTAAGPPTAIGATLDQERSVDYRAFFVESLFRMGSFHIVP